MIFAPAIESLILALRSLPGVGPKTAQRLAFHILSRDRDAGKRLAQSLEQAVKSVRHCDQCRNFCDQAVCNLCTQTRRDPRLLCIVESPLDIVAIEQTGTYNGFYFVLLGYLSPLDGIGPQELGMNVLQKRLQVGTIEEVILATNPTVEGDATAHYLAQLCAPHKVKISRIAFGIPMGGELEWVSCDTLTRALQRRELWSAEALASER